MLLCCDQLWNPVEWRHVTSKGKYQWRQSASVSRMKKTGVIQYFCNHKHQQDITEHFCSSETHGYNVMLLVKTQMNFLVM
jgi:hypothetical protein